MYGPRIDLVLSLTITTRSEWGGDKLNWVIKLNVLKEKQERLLRQDTTDV